MQRLSTPLPFLEALEALKVLKRSAWRQRGIPDPENVGNHMYQMIWLCYLHPELTADDQAHAAMMCVVHDVGEIHVSNLTQADSSDTERAQILEKLGVQYLSCLLQKALPDWALLLPKIWLEYTQSRTQITQLVGQIDKFECLHQAFIYRKRLGEFKSLEEFKELRNSITDPWLAEQADMILVDWTALELDSIKSPIIFVVGGPGVGKGTVCAKAAQGFGFEHISVGDVLREEQKTPGSPFGQFIAESIQASAVVPPSLTLLLLKSRIQMIQSRGKGILLDGFPRSVEQAVAFEQEISPSYSTVYLEAPDEIMIKRVQQRSLSSERSDDDVTILKRRIDTFRSSETSILQHLAKNRLLRVDATGNADQVYSLLEEMIAPVTGDGGG